MRDYREFLRDYREFFQKVKRDYKARVKIFQGYLDFEQSIKIWGESSNSFNTGGPGIFAF